MRDKNPSNKPILQNFTRRRRDFRSLQFESVIVDARDSFYVGAWRKSHLPFCWHYHPELEIDLVVKGQGLRFVGDSVRNFEEGDLCLLGANLPHTWNSVLKKGQRVRTLYVQFSKECFGQGFFNAAEMRPLERLFIAAQNGLQFHGRTQQELTECLLRLEKRPRHDWRRIYDLVWILGTMAESKETTPLSTGGMDLAQSKSSSRRLQNVLDFMNAPGADTIPRQKMAAKIACLSTQAFSRFFKRSMGKTYVEYRNELRVGRACRLLLDTDRSITEIALSSGFNNLSNFNAQFLHIKGMTPRAYREAWFAKKDRRF